MNQTLRLFFVLAGGIASSLLCTESAWAETWSDATGKFQIEAEYAGVQGTSVVLRKPDGKTVTVPIARLSAESRAQAKRLYELAKSSGGSPVPAASSTATAPAAPLKFTPPTPPAIPPMAAFPENASLQETVDFLQAQILAGHPEVFWFALPSEVRTALDDTEFRTTITQQFKEQAATQQSMKRVAMKLVEVLITKKDFLFNTPLMAKVPEPLLPTIQQAYDPAVGLLYELAMFSFDFDSLANLTCTEFVNDHGPRIGGHLQALAKMAPPGTIDPFLTQIVVEETGDSGTITTPDQKNGTRTTEMVKFQGRWIPKDFAEQWEANKETLARDLAAAAGAAKASNPEAVQQASMMAGAFVAMAEGALQPLLDANTQQDFDQAMTQVTAMLGMLGGGGAGGAGERGGVEINRTFKDGVEVEP